MPTLAAYFLPHPPLAVPEIGEGKETKLSLIREGYRKVAREIASLAPDTIIISSPHAESYSDFIQFSEGEVGIGSFGDFGHKEINFRFLYDRELTAAIAEIASADRFPAGSEGGEDMSLDHGTLVPLYFINQSYTSYKVVRLGLSGLSYMEHYKMGTIIKEAVERLGRKAVFIASGDLSHTLGQNGPFGYSGEGEEYDRLSVDALREGNFRAMLDMDPQFVRKANVCGHRCFCIGMGVLDSKDFDTTYYGYEKPYGIGYAMLSYKVKPEGERPSLLNAYLDEQRELARRRRENADPYAKLCYEAIKAYLLEDKVIPVPEGFPSSGKKRGSCFVTVKKCGNMNGCLGTIQPTKKNLGEEIIANAIEASTDDPRFLSLNESDLDYLTFEVDVVSRLEPCKFADLDPERYGIVVTNGPRRGVLLPGLSEITDPKAQLDIALKKAGIAREERYSLQRFEITKHV